MEENKQNSSDLADLPDLELDDLEFQEQAAGLDSLDNETESNLDEAFGDLDFSAEGETSSGLDPFADIDSDAVATGDYDLPADEATEDFDSTSTEAMDWGDTSFEEETFDPAELDGSESSDSNELTDFDTSSDDEIPLPPMMEEDDGPVSLSEDELDRILSTDEEGSSDEPLEGSSLEEVDMAESDFSAGPDFGESLDDSSSSSMDDFSTDDFSMSDESISMDSDSSVADLEDAFVDDTEGISQEDFSDLENDFSADIPEQDASSSADADWDQEVGEVPDMEEDEGPVALSEDELGNILEDVEDGDPQFAEGLLPEDELPGISLNSMEDDMGEEISELSTEEDLGLGDGVTVKSGDDFSAASEDTDFPVFEDELEMDGPASGDQSDMDDLDISDDELSEAVLEGDDFSDEDFQSPPLSVLDAEEDESITLTPEELGNIVSDGEEYSEESDNSVAEQAEAVAFDEPGIEEFADMEEAPVSESHGLEGFQEQEEDFGPTPSILDEDEDETIALSASELDNILEDVSEEAIEETGSVMGSEMPGEDVAAHEQERERNAIVIDEPEDEVSEATSQRQEALADSLSQAEGLNKDELKKMISYLDRLFDQLPDDTVREFSRSEYFDLYKKLMQDLGIQ